MKLNIPENLNEITIKQFFDFKKCAETSNDEFYLRLAMISIFCDVSIEDLKTNLNVKDFNEITDYLTNVLKSEPMHVERFTIAGKEYGFIPNLDNITAGEYIELDELFKDETTYLEQMATMYRPVTKKVKGLYNIEPFESSEMYKDIMSAAPISAYLGAKVFFCNLLKELLISLTFYLKEQQTNELLAQHLASVGVGTNQYIQSLEAMYTNLKKQQVWTFTHF